MIRMIAIVLWLLAFAPGSLERATVLADPCDHYLFNGDSYLGEADCPNLPALDTTGVVRTELPAGARKARVRWIYDGDTIQVSIGHDYFRVRVMGVDTPEEYDPDVPVECFAAAAKAYTASLIPVGTLIYLDKDVTDYDRYGRRLRNIWFLDAAGNYRLLQDSLVRNGYAVISTFPPDVKYVTFLADAQRHAQASGRGLWSACGGPDVPDGSPPPTPTPSLTDSNACDPAYPEVCIPPVSQSGDLDCRDIPYHWFVVLKPDPHNFDVDGDGFGCQS